MVQRKKSRCSASNVISELAERELRWQNERVFNPPYVIQHGKRISSTAIGIFDFKWDEDYIHKDIQPKRMEDNMALKKASSPKKLVKETIIQKTATNSKPIAPITAIAKVEVAPNLVVAPGISKESNLKRLAGSPIIADFVKRTHCEWNHQDWLALLGEIKEKGFDPIDSDQVGLLLEERRAQILAAKND